MIAVVAFVSRILPVDVNAIQIIPAIDPVYIVGENSSTLLCGDGGREVPVNVVKNP